LDSKYGALGKIERLVYMTKDFKKWWRENYKEDATVIHATQKSLNEYMRVHSHHPIIKGVMFDEKITLTGNFFRIDIIGCAFFKGLSIIDFSVFGDTVLEDIGVAEKLVISNVFLTRNLHINQNLGEIIPDGMKSVSIYNLSIKGSIIYQR
jgi:hypothetical protein